MTRDTSTAAPLRTMIIGDSMTQGGEGDFTWRYRLWEWLRDQHVSITFTGPYKGTQEPGEPDPPKPPPLYKHEQPDPPVRCHGGYAKSTSHDFDSHHFAVWGRQCAVAKDLVEDVVRHHSAHLLLIMLGFNDIGWFVSDAKGTLASMKQLVTNARRANPKVTMLIANIPQRTKMDGREDLPISTSEYNTLLHQAVQEWSTPGSKLYLVDVCSEYTADTSTFDGLHPNSLGDYQIATAFSIAICNGLGLGANPLTVPSNIPVRPLPIPSTFQLVSSPTGVTAVWDEVYGAFGYEFKFRINDGDSENEASGSNRWDSHWASEGSVYEAQVCSLYGNQARSDWTILRSATARPLTAPPPTDIVVREIQKGVLISWKAPKQTHGHQILQYSFLWRDKDGSMFFPGLAALKGSPAEIDELQHGHSYDVCMLTWSTAGEGTPSDWKEITLSDGRE